MYDGQDGEKAKLRQSSSTDEKHRQPSGEVCFACLVLSFPPWLLPLPPHNQSGRQSARQMESKGGMEGLGVQARHEARDTRHNHALLGRGHVSSLARCDSRWLSQPGLNACQRRMMGKSRP